MPKMKHPEGGTIETSPAYVEMYESQGYETVKSTPAKKATAAKQAEPASTTDAETK